MTLKELYKVIDGYAPFVLSEEYKARGMHDNSGILVDCGKVSRVLFTLDLSMTAVGEAKKAGADCIVTHHPAIWAPLYNLTGGPVLACARENISVVSAHLNLDAAERGIDDSLMRGLGGKEPIAVMEKLSCGGYGRVYDVAPSTLSEFCEGVKKTFSTERVLVYGKKPVRRVASFCGAGFTESAIGFALEHGADTVVSSDEKHHLLLEAAERGLNVLLLTHYASENYGFLRFAETIQKTVGASVFFTDERLL